MQLSGDPYSNASPRPIGTSEAYDCLVRSFPEAAGRIVLAVSGGADSLALLVFAGENKARLRAAGHEFLVVTIDHNLRPEAAAEARFVAETAARYGLAHRTQSWHREAGGNLSARAREGRYRLLVEAARDLGASCIVTAHHRDDQIETHRMALDRGEGPLRLAGMRVKRDLAPGLVLLRPLLNVPKARLVESLQARGLVWMEDPGNRDPRSSRARVRQELDRAGEEQRAACLERIARAGAERVRLDHALALLVRNIRLDRAAVLRCRRSDLDRDPSASAAFLSRILRAAGGSARPASSGEIEGLLKRLRGETFAGATLGGVQISARAGDLCFAREFGRSGPPPVVTVPGRPMVFDERFDVAPRDEQGRIVPFGSLGSAAHRHATLPVFVSHDDRPYAAHGAIAGRTISGWPELDCRERISWRLAADLPSTQAIIQIAAKGVAPVGNELSADYLGKARTTRLPVAATARSAMAPFQDG